MSSGHMVEKRLSELEARDAILCSELAQVISDRLALQDRQSRLEAELSNVRQQIEAAKSGKNLLEGYVETILSKARVVNGKVEEVPREEYETRRTSTAETRGDVKEVDTANE